MPDLNPRKVEEDEQKVDRAWLRGLVHGYLQVVESDERRVWEFFREGASSLVVTGGEPTAGQLHLLHEALRHNPSIVDHTLERAAQESERDRGQYGEQLDKHHFYDGNAANRALGGTLNMIDVVLRFTDGGPPDEARERKRDALLALLLDEIAGYFRQAIGSHQARTAGLRAADFIEQLAAGSTMYQQADRDSREFRVWQNVIEGRVRALRAG
jgi:hypothetical protein